ncbi:MAG: hypothetical protein E7107_11655 [Prevotella sp.]|nr:hypothetical protein [Prevotella sp.]
MDDGCVSGITFVSQCSAAGTYNNIQSAAAYFSFVINDDIDNTTGINSLTPTSSPKGEGSDYYYSLSGRRIEGRPTEKGLYIHQGKKVIIK